MTRRLATPDQTPHAAPEQRRNKDASKRPCTATVRPQTETQGRRKRKRWSAQKDGQLPPAPRLERLQKQTGPRDPQDDDATFCAARKRLQRRTIRMPKRSRARVCGNEKAPTVSPKLPRARTCGDVKNLTAPRKLPRARPCGNAKNPAAPQKMSRRGLRAKNVTFLCHTLKNVALFHATQQF